MSQARNQSKWFIDKEKSRWIYHRIKRNVLNRKTKYQHVEIFDTAHLGRVVVLDKKIQSAELDEFIYHEALVHPAMIAHTNPKKILILGGGEGATLREVLLHPTVQNVTMIDIDKEFVDICKIYLKKWHGGSFKDPRVKLIHEDAFTYIKKTKTMFDIIITDISDPLNGGPASLIYTNKFYSMVKNVLKVDGIFVTHATEINYLSHKNIAYSIFTDLKKIYKKSYLYYDYIPSFGTLWGFIAASLEYNLRELSPRIVADRLRRRRLENLSYYNAHSHIRVFTLPVFLKKLFV